MTPDETTIRAVKTRITYFELELIRMRKLLKADKQWLEKLLKGHEHVIKHKFCELCEKRVVCSKCDNPYDEECDSFGVCLECWKKGPAYG